MDNSELIEQKFKELAKLIEYTDNPKIDYIFMRRVENADHMDIATNCDSRILMLFILNIINRCIISDLMEKGDEIEKEH